MAALAGLFGGLSGVADFGEQRAEATQAARDEIQKRLVEEEQRQAYQQQRLEAQQRLKEQQLRYQIEQQPVPSGARYTGPGGKQYQPYQNLDGTLSVKELPGPAPQTQEEALYNALIGIGVPPEDAQKAVVGQVSPRTQTFRDFIPVPGQSGMVYDVRKDIYGNVLSVNGPVLPPAGYVPTQTKSVQFVDPAHPGVQTTDTTRSKVMPTIGGIAPGMMPAVGAGGSTGDPAVDRWLQTYGPGGPAGALGITPPSAGITAPPAVPRSAGGAVPTTPLAAPRLAAPGTTAAPPPPVTAPATPQAVTPTSPAQAAPGDMGPYRGLDATGQIPSTYPADPELISYANRLIQGADADKLFAGVGGARGPALRTGAWNLAKKFGWWGQGALTPQQQMQIAEVDDALTQAIKSYDKWKDIFDNPAMKAYYATIPLDPHAGAEGGLGAAIISLQHTATSRAGADFIGILNRMRGVVTGVRQMTGSSTAEGAANRMLAELPTFIGAKDSKDALFKMQQFQRELSFMKKLGYPASQTEAVNRLGIQSPPPPAPFPGAPPVGTIEDGHRYVGGDPGDSSNWQLVKP